MPLRNITFAVLSFQNGNCSTIGTFPSMPLAEAEARVRAERNPGKEYAAVEINRVFGAPVGVVERELQAPNDMGIGEDQPLRAAPFAPNIDDVLNRLALQNRIADQQEDV